MTTPLPVLPQIFVEAGLVTANPVQPATTLLLNDAVHGLLGTGTLGSSVSWTSIAPWVKSFTITRPSTRLQGPLWNYQASTVSILLDNSDGRFDPDNIGGPYVLSGVTQLTAMVPVRVRAVFNSVTYLLYSGYADGWLPGQVTYEGGYAELTLPATDAFKVLAGITLPTVSTEGTGADTGARVRDILTRAGWYTSAEYLSADTGDTLLQGTTLGSDALSLMQVAVDSEAGQLYVNGAGAVTFRHRRALVLDSRSAFVQAVFGDLPGTGQSAGIELAYAGIARSSDDTTLVNDIQATRVGGTLQEAQDTASIIKYLFPRTYARSDLILQSDSDAMAWASWVLYIGKGAQSGQDRFDSLQVDPQADPANLWPQVLGREIGDRIQVWTRPAGVASALSLGIADGTFESGVSTWQVFNGTVAQSSAQSHTGSFSALVTATTAVSSTYLRPVSADYVPVVPGTWYTCGLWIDASQGGTTFSAVIDWCDASKAVLSSSTGPSASPAALSWTGFQVTGQAPAGAAFARYGPTMTPTTIGNSYYADDITFMMGAPVAKDCFIAGITHAWDSAASTWLTTWALQDASKYSGFLTLNNATLGQLGSNPLLY